MRIGRRRAIAATLWNAAAVSLGGMALYYVMLARGTAARATANFYLVPGTAALMAWVLLDERLSALTLVGLGGFIPGMLAGEPADSRCAVAASAREQRTCARATAQRCVLPLAVYLTANCVLPNMTSRSASVIWPLRWWSASTATPRCTAGRAAIASCQRFTFG